MKRLLLFLILSLAPFQGSLYAQISGVINQYTPVTQISCNQVDVQSTSFLAVGDRVLIIQMKGAEINLSNNASFGTVINYHNCGNYELATVAALSGNSVTLQNQLFNSYDIPGHVQLIRVPQYTNVTVTNTLTAQDWNGSTGGVLVMEVSGTLTLNAPISLNGKGFRGSFASSNPDGGCGNFPDYFYPVLSGYGAAKGEGIAEVGANMNGGRGALANGGGGGNKHNSGGGGGSNGSKGGRGGDQAGFCGQLPIGGEGGMALNYGSGKLFMGGGGGSPDYNDNVGSAGANGGGIIIIRAATIQSNNNMFIESDGGNVVSTGNSIGDGSGGGGAGGTIALDVAAVAGNLQLRVNGGDGGNQQTSYPSCFGPGGGGGTGAILFSGSSMLPNITTQFIPGDAGTDMNASSSCYLQHYGAAPGQSSPVYVYNSLLTESGLQPGTFDLGPDIAICDASAFINPGLNAVAYSWSTGETTPAITVASSGEYWLSANFGNGCWMADTISVDLNSLAVNAGPDQIICTGQNILLHAVTVSGNAVLSWNNGVTDNVPFSPPVTTVYTVTATDQSAGCSATDSVLVTVNPLPVVAVSPSAVSGCVPFTVNFSNQTGNCSTAVWSFSNGTTLNGCIDQQVIVTDPGCYDLALQVVSPEGCTASSNFPSIICGLASPTASFLPSPQILSAENPTSAMSNHSLGGVAYEWNFGDGSGASDEFEPTYTYSSETFGTYTVSLKVTDQNGCTDIAYMRIYMEGGLIYYVPNTFTPDGNEFNQVFLPVFTEGIDLQEYSLLIFNRWGELVFETNDPFTGWDGSYLGVLSPKGAYTWQIQVKLSANSALQLVQGHLNLLR